MGFDPEAGTGHVRVTIDIASLTLGAVSDNAKGPDFLNSAQFPEAVFEGDIAPAPPAARPISRRAI
ncbi:YceI family protein [Paracoccus cavernae]|uniref:YceI family protein n=1 Tax=Paracoccus cavernae TaxID=1571207 RepID=A0ABT8D2J4_9RHOB|nr:YceI family protein [Paracoccus cavernae]